MARWLRRTHVVMTSIVGAQLVVWVTTGLAFTLFDFDVVRGTADRSRPTPIAFSAVGVGVQEAARIAGAKSSGAAVRSVVLEALAGRPTYTIAFVGEKKEVMVDAATGAVVGIDTARAANIAGAAFRGGGRAESVERRSSDGRDTYVVRLDDARATEVTIDAVTGAVTAWQNRSFRFFDALWSAHVLGYLDRTSPANWPLRAIAFLAFAAVASGTGLLFVRLRTWLASRRSPAHAPLSPSGDFPGASALPDGST
jgi:Na+-transporting NADH:ubiquinone oxidoreductase subunit F